MRDESEVRWGSIYAGDVTVTMICLANIWHQVTYVGNCTRYSSSEVNSLGVQTASNGTRSSLTSTLLCGLVRCHM